MSYNLRSLWLNMFDTRIEVKEIGCCSMDSTEQNQEKTKK